MVLFLFLKIISPLSGQLWLNQLLKYACVNPFTILYNNNVSMCLFRIPYSRKDKTGKGFNEDYYFQILD